MPSDTPLTDDYVADILRKEASRDSNRYLASGLGSLLSRPRSNAPKPNTRFLRNIIRDTDSHNAALKAREEADSRARLRSIRHDDERRHRSDERRRRDDDRNPRTSRDSHRHDRDRAERKGLRRSRSPQPHSEDEDRSHRKRRKYNDERQTSRRHREPRIRSQPRSPPSRSPSPRAQSPQPDTRRHHRRKRRPHFQSRSPSRTRRPQSPDPDPTSDSDPLEALLGPLPAPTVRARGRGAHKVSAIDARFGADYDPSRDDHDDDDGGGVDSSDPHHLAADGTDDWELALNSLRDRAKWRKTRGERLRAAGFTEEEVKKFEGGPLGWSREKKGQGEGGEKDVGDVRWAKKGEGREWDRGKVLNGNSVDVVPEWGRLKGT